MYHFGNCLFPTFVSSAMQTIDVPQSASLYRYIGQTPAGVKLHEKKVDFETAYRVASLGVTEDDWRFLALMSLQKLQMHIAKKAFIRLRDLRHLDLLDDIQQYIKANGKGKDSKDLSDDQLHMVTALVAAFQGRFGEAAAQFCAANEHQKAIDMYTDLRKWEDAKKLAQQFEGVPVLQEKSDIDTSMGLSPERPPAPITTTEKLMRMQVQNILTKKNKTMLVN